MKSCILSLIALMYCFGLSAQSNYDAATLKNELDTLNRQIDHWVVQKNTGLLKKYYADDFVFTHGTGHVDSKASWLENVAKPGTQFVSRLHDSTAVELHPNLAIVTGTLTVVRKTAAPGSNYAVRYVRVYARQKKDWQMVSHRTVLQWSL
ncbi:nuclear transport factor 2 family protein [Chitinophagaceae bacterium LB-8]|uniref:Nuclear transport factor 2 family protein n=1 Tax=Paraflavisolibacter caeni TaxID=2982496 RepID=A0A9X2XU12_9BACT|nr:nuclear transport factor 2 family protein [Paraflavisolibacter caeni]MCU7548457.1 nuclear transport factor 2 family protein [Paraflavisolibacter caeni]